MTANPEIVFNNMAYGRIKGGISVSTEIIELYPGDVQLFLPQWASGKIMYLTITDSQNHIEVVKVTGISGQKLTASRGQDGTVAIQWYDGAIINHRMPAALLDACIQKEAARQVAYNPNGILSPAYKFEKVYETVQGTWWKNVSGTVWNLIAGRYTPIISCHADRINNGVDTPNDSSYIWYDYSYYLGEHKYDNIKLGTPTTSSSIERITFRVRNFNSGSCNVRLYDHEDSLITTISPSYHESIEIDTDTVYVSLTDDQLEGLYVNFGAYNGDVIIYEFELQLYSVGDVLEETIYPSYDLIDLGYEWFAVPECL